MINNSNKRVLFIMAKFPIPGFVKTRLARSIGDENATNLYTAFLKDLTPRFLTKNGNLSFDVCWVFTPNTENFKSLIHNFYGDESIDHVMFKGFEAPGLAEQQIEMFKWAQENGYKQAIVMTSDSPHLSREIVENSFRDLDEKDMVIGPTLDGGYYLLGIRDNWNVLENVTMSTNHVAEDIIKNAKRLHKSVSTQEIMTDIDTIEDLELFKQLMTNYDLSFCSHTRKELEKI